MAKKRIFLPGLLLAGILVSLPSCQQVSDLLNESNRQIEKLQKENEKLKKQVDQLTERLAQAEAEGVVNKVLVALYDLRHALERFAQKNEGKYPFANNINELQSVLKGYLPENFEVEAVYLEKVRSQQKGYIMIANVKGQEIVVSNLL